MQIRSASVLPSQVALSLGSATSLGGLDDASACGQPNARLSFRGGPDLRPLARGRSGLVPAHDRPESRCSGRRHASEGEGLQRLPVCIGRHALAGELTLVPGSRGLVVIVHGCGSNCRIPKHELFADIVHGYRLDTLQFDLLSAAEGHDCERDSDVDLLTQRLVEALRWARADERIRGQCTGLLGACAGAAASLRAAAQHPGWVAAVVLRGGQPHLAAPWLARVQAPTLLIVGGRDTDLLGLNRAAARHLRCDWRLEVVPGATNQFEESGATETVAHLAGNWFGDRLRLPVS